MQLIFALLLALLSLLGELLCGALGATPPFLAITVFYLTKENSPAVGIFTAIFWGLLQDLALGRDFLFTPFKLLILLAVLQLLYRKPCRHLAEAFPAGAVIGAVTTLANALCAGLYGNFRPGGELAAALFFNSAAVALWMPVQLFFSDYPAGKMKLPLFFQPEKTPGGNRQRRIRSQVIQRGERP